MRQATEEDKARQIFGAARDQLRSEVETLAWDDLPDEACAFYTRFLRLAVVDAIRGAASIRRDVLEYWGTAARRASKRGISVGILVEPEGLQVTAQGPSGDQAMLGVTWAELNAALTPKGAIDEIISHLRAQLRPPENGGIVVS